MNQRLAELLDRVCDTPGPISGALSASEWHELRDLAAARQSFTVAGPLFVCQPTAS